MAFTHLPNEILEFIIKHSIPEGIESLALTCKEIHALCTPFIEHHNALRSHFRSFTYGYRKALNTRILVTRPAPLLSANMIITQIAVEPVVARYIQRPNLFYEGQFTRYDKAHQKLEGNADYYNECVAKLLADSPYLKEAGLDWKEYHAVMKEDFRTRLYSQHAAAFFLTLLPNVEMVKLPGKWKPIEATDKLVQVIVQRARQKRFVYDTPSMGQTTGVIVANNLDIGAAFLDLPLVRYFECYNCTGVSTTSSEYSYRSIYERLQVVKLTIASLDEETLAAFLKCTPALQSLHYSHSAIGRFVLQDWTFCKIINTIEREVGAHLTKLCISIFSMRGCEVRGKASMHNFQRLETLEFPLEIAMSNLATSESRDYDLGDSEFCLGDLVPASVSQLSLLSGGKREHMEALKVMFRDFAERRELEVPALQHIYLSCPVKEDKDYRDFCKTLAIEIEKAGVAVHLRNDSRPLPEWIDNY